MALQIAILGSVEPRMNGHVVGVPAGKQRALLTLLAVRAPRPVSAEAAAEALWPRAAPAEAMRSLQVTVSRLRRSLGAAGSALETVASGYRLAVEADAIDARRFEMLIAEARAARVEGDGAAARRLLDDALGLWRGPALADVGFESFAQAEIARLDELRVAALEERIDVRLSEGEHALVVAELEQLSAEHPSRERLVGLLMLALYRCGRQSDALEVYTRGRRRLDEELGLEPSPELQRLQEAILRHDPSLEAAGPGDRHSTRGSSAAPEGVVTMLFTDIEGSTRLARAAGSVWPQLLAEHHALVLDAVERAGGHLDGSEGDALFAYFVDPDAAVEAASAAQQALRRQAWPEPVGELRVRMGIHAGLVSRSATGYSGLEVHLAARVMAAGHGGQIVVSDAARALLASRSELVDVGEHRLKDFPAPERLWLLVHDDRGPGAFPPLRTEPVRPTNLPADPRRLVGREAELDLLWDMLTGKQRLVTILGLGGTGKTRLAVAAAEGLLSAFEGGVWLVALAGVRDPVALIPAIAAALAVADADDRSPEEAVAQRLRARPTLLVLDNFEQLVDGAPAVAALLGHAPGTRVLITSQLPLRIAHEYLLRLAPLSADSAVTLFDERARAAAPDFDLGEHREAVEAICARVDGMPLALELAGARVSTLAPGELLARLDHSLGVLARGPRDLAERHRSLRAALDWTHALLEPGEQVLLARLAAFAGPAPLDAVEAVAEVPGERGPVDALEALSGLVDASFVQRTDSREHGVRYTVAQAVRDFAAERLAASSEEHAVRAAHAAHVAAVGETFRGVGTPDPVVARVVALEAEFRVALAWTREHAPALHTRVAAALGLVLNDYGRARDAHAELGLAIERSGVTDATGGWAAVVRAFTAIALGSSAEAPLMEAGLAALRAAGDVPKYQLALRVAGVYWLFAEEPERALEYSAEGLAVARGRPHLGDLAPALVDHANVLIELERLDEAEALLKEAAPLLPQLGASNLDADGIFDDLAAARGDWARAARLFVVNAHAAERDPGLKAMLLRHVAIALAHLGADEDALELAATANAICESIGEAPNDPLTTRYGQALDEARERLGPERSAHAARRGVALPEADSTTRAAEMVQTARVTRAR
jgi:predicted ATPase/DNA-binding SARP family transcriptional activator